MVNLPKNSIALVLKVLAICFGIYAVYQFYFHSPWEKITLYHKNALVFAFLLMPLNWLLESKRWQILLNPLFKISIVNALIGVLSGLAGSFLAGRTIGNALGRFWALPPTLDRKQSVGALFVSQLTQGIHTFWVGGISLLWFFSDELLKWNVILPLILITFLGSFAIFFFWERVKSLAFIQNVIRKYFLVFEVYSVKIVIVAFLLGLLRYSVYFTQFILVIISINTAISVEHLFTVVPSIFLIKTILPNLGGFLDLGVREVSTLYLFEYLGYDPNTALMSALMIWGINILIPSLIGLGVRWKL